MRVSGIAMGSICAATAVLVLGLAGCGQQQKDAQAKGQGAVPEAMVTTLAPQRVEIISELPGRTTPYRVAEVRPQVTGVVLKRLFTEGGEVRADQQLYAINPASYQAAYDSARASLARAQAALNSAQLLAERYRTLIEAHAVSKQQYDDAVATQQQAEADIASAKAAIETARINLVYTKVLAPISGRVGRSTVTEGALVTSDQTAALATVQQLDPIYVDVTQSTTQLLRLQRELANGQLQTASANQATVKLVFDDGTEYSQPGKLLFSEVTVDQGTGSVTMRAVFPNPQRELLPGMFVHARLVEGVHEQALLVPQRGVSRNQRGEPTALVVGQDNKVEMRVLKVDRAIDDKWLVLDGVKAGDKVVVEGLQKARPGMVVRAVEANNLANEAPQAQPTPGERKLTQRQ
jgi:membrane fusion protein (multidrug efflux system)